MHWDLRKEGFLCTDGPKKMRTHFVIPGVLFLLILARFSVSSHFRGGVIQWKPLDANPDNFDGRVRKESNFALILLSYCVKFTLIL